MNHECKSGATEQSALVTVNAGHLAQLATLSGHRLFAASAPAKTAAQGTIGPLGAAPGVQTHFHVTAEGEALATTSFAEGQTGDIVVRGVIAGIPYELHIRVAFEGEQVAVTLHLTKPFEVGPYTWRFDIGGAIKDASGSIVAATSVTPAADLQPMGLNWWCVLKCGGAAILPTLLACLPSLAGGPAAYVACVTGKLGAADAAKIALCVAKNCR